jgi:alpha-1,3-glucosyltransferase
MIDPAWMALKASRGLESYESKLFMRGTVLVWDIAVYFTAVAFFIAKPLDAMLNRTATGPEKVRECKAELFDL